MTHDVSQLHPPVVEKGTKTYLAHRAPETVLSEGVRVIVRECTSKSNVWYGRCQGAGQREPAAGPAGPVIRSQPTFSPMDSGELVGWPGLGGPDDRPPVTTVMMPAAAAHVVAARRGAVRAPRGWLRGRHSVIRHILPRPDG